MQKYHNYPFKCLGQTSKRGNPRLEATVQMAPLGQVGLLNQTTDLQRDISGPHIQVSCRAHNKHPITDIIVLRLMWELICFLNNARVPVTGSYH